jgi:GAF domain-containing protein
MRLPRRAVAAPAASDVPDAAGIRQRFRAAVAELLRNTLDARATLDEIAGLAVPELADLCVVDLVDDAGALHGGGVATSAEPSASARIRRLRADAPLDPAGAHPVAVAARTGTVQFVPSATPDVLRSFAANEEHYQGMVELGYSSAIVVPLIARGRTLGVLSLLYLGRLDDPRRYTPADVEVVVEVAGLAAQALENARLFANLRGAEARQEAILAGMTQAVTAEDVNGRLLFANQSAADFIGAATPAELLTWTYERFTSRYRVTDEHGRPIPQARLPAAAVFAGERPEPLLVNILDLQTGDERWSQVNATPVHDDDGKVVMAVTVSDDVTAVKQAEAVQRFLASASKLLGASLDVDTTLTRAAETVVPALADWCRVDVVDEQGRLVPAALAHPEGAPPEHVDLARRVPRLPASDPRSAWHVLHTGEPVLIADVGVDAAPVGDMEQIELADRLGLRSVAVVPMTAGDKIVGLLTLATSRSRRTLHEQELGLALELGRRAGTSPRRCSAACCRAGCPRSRA